MYGHPNGVVKTCCAGIDDFGSLKTNSLEEIWHNDKFTQLRKDFIAGDVTDLVKSNCATCVNFEKSGIHSLRDGLNSEFTKHAVIEEKPDLNLLYIDFRFNNFCNFKCRGCYYEYSSSIANEDAGKPVPIIFAGKTPDDLYNQTLPHLEYTKKIYFAGGEPLIQWEHWKILDKLLEQNNTDISLVYNTNFSTMKYKNKNIVDANNISDSDVILYLRDKIESYKIPSQIEWIDRIPKTESGKTQRHLLRQVHKEKKRVDYLYFQSINISSTGWVKFILCC
jgi:organic radical activating enzyme